MTQFKDKAGKDREQASLGLYAYPSLMAADILVYRATHVPVGDDQKQHLELTRDIAMKFNLDYMEHIRRSGYGIDITVGDEPVHAYFPMVEPLIDGPAPRVMSLRDGTKKMSKSDASDLSRINLLDDEENISKKIRKAKTDPDGLPSEIAGLAGRPEADNLVGIYAALADKSKADVLSAFGGQQFSVFKPALVDLAVHVLSPITGEMRRLMADPGHIDTVLRDGSASCPCPCRSDDEAGPRHHRLYLLRLLISYWLARCQCGAPRPTNGWPDLEYLADCFLFRKTEPAAIPPAS